jgi:hypothetical protein
VNLHLTNAHLTLTFLIFILFIVKQIRIYLHEMVIVFIHRGRNLSKLKFMS